MFYAHYFMSSPDGILIVQVYAGGYLFQEYTFTRKELYHSLISTLTQIDRDINPQCYSEENWSPELTKFIIDATRPV